MIKNTLQFLKSIKNIPSESLEEIVTQHVHASHLSTPLIGSAVTFSGLPPATYFVEPPRVMARVLTINQLRTALRTPATVVTNSIANQMKKSGLQQSDLIDTDNQETTLTLADKSEKEANLDELIIGMPETSKLKTESALQTRFRRGFQEPEITVQELTLILNKQKRMIEFLSKLRGEEQFYKEVLKQLNQDRKFLVSTGLLKVKIDPNGKIDSSENKKS